MYNLNLRKQKIQATSNIFIPIACKGSRVILYETLIFKITNINRQIRFHYATKYIVSEMDFIISETKYIVSEMNFIISETKYIVSEMNFIISETKYIVSEMNFIISENKYIVSEGKIPSRIEIFISSRSREIRSKNHFIRSNSPIIRSNRNSYP